MRRDAVRGSCEVRKLAYMFKHICIDVCARRGRGRERGRACEWYASTVCSNMRYVRLVQVQVCNFMRMCKWV